jgi:hypothetical protein
MTLISVAVVSRPVNAHQSLTTNPAPMTSDPRFTVPACARKHVYMSRIWRKDGSTHHKRDLKQATKLVLILYARFGVHEPALVREGAVRADKDVFRDRLSEDLDLEHVRDDLLCLAVDVGVYERNVVVARDHVPKRR